MSVALRTISGLIAPPGYRRGRSGGRADLEVGGPIPSMSVGSAIRWDISEGIVHPGPLVGVGFRRIWYAGAVEGGDICSLAARELGGQGCRRGRQQGRRRARG